MTIWFIPIAFVVTIFAMAGGRGRGLRVDRAWLHRRSLLCCWSSGSSFSCAGPWSIWTEERYLLWLRLMIGISTVLSFWFPPGLFARLTGLLERYAHRARVAVCLGWCGWRATLGDSCCERHCRLCVERRCSARMNQRGLEPRPFSAGAALSSMRVRWRPWLANPQNYSWWPSVRCWISGAIRWLPLVPAHGDSVGGYYTRLSWWQWRGRLAVTRSFVKQSVEAGRSRKLSLQAPLRRWGWFCVVRAIP